MLTVSPMIIPVFTAAWKKVIDNHTILNFHPWMVKIVWWWWWWWPHHNSGDPRHCHSSARPHSRWSTPSDHTWTAAPLFKHCSDWWFASCWWAKSELCWENCGVSLMLRVMMMVVVFHWPPCVVVLLPVAYNIIIRHTSNFSFVNFFPQPDFVDWCASQAGGSKLSSSAL